MIDTSGQPDGHFFKPRDQPSDIRCAALRRALFYLRMRITVYKMHASKNPNKQPEW